VEKTFYNLNSIFDRLNTQYFGGQLTCKLVWGRVRKQHVRRSRTLGRYMVRNNKIMINRVLDQRQIPFYVIASIIHHEMCHAVVRPKRHKGRVSYHSAEFRTKEKEFEQYPEARAWIRQNLAFLFKAPKKGKPVKTEQLDLFSGISPLPGKVKKGLWRW
jgi:predicted SprT family Zn-dependent metalloprotease